MWSLRPALSVKTLLLIFIAESASLHSPFILQQSPRQRRHPAGLNYKREGSKCHVFVEVKDKRHPPSDSFHTCDDLLRFTLIAFSYVYVCISVPKCAGASAGQICSVSLETQLLVVAKCPTWMLGTELRSLQEQNILITRSPSHLSSPKAKDV